MRPQQGEVTFSRSHSSWQGVEQENRSPEKAGLEALLLHSWRPDRRGSRGMGTKDKVALYGSHPFQEKTF